MGIIKDAWTPNAAQEVHKAVYRAARKNSMYRAHPHRLEDISHEMDKKTFICRLEEECGLPISLKQEDEILSLGKEYSFDLRALGRVASYIIQLKYHVVEGQ